MHRIDTLTAEADLHGSGKDGFRDGQPPGVASTRLNASWFNAVQEELMTLIDGGVGATDPTYVGQLVALLQSILTTNYTALTPGSSYSGSFGGAAYVDSTTANRGHVLAVGDSGGLQTIDTGTSDDEAMTARTAAGGFSGQFYDCAGWADGELLAVGDSGEIQLSTNNGVGWSQYASGGGDNLRCVATRLSTKLAATAGASGAIYTSTNGTSWTARTADGSYADAFLGALVTSAGTLLLCGENGEIQRSTDDGATWSSVLSVGTDDYIGFTEAYGAIYAFRDDGGGGVVQKSTDDGLTWSSVATDAIGSAVDIKCVAWTGFAHVVGGISDFAFGTRQNAFVLHRLGAFSGTLNGMAVGNRRLYMFGDSGLALASMRW